MTVPGRSVGASLMVACLADMFTLTQGVHGPTEVHAIFVDAPLRG
jgi:hypothetical protein